jgi:hypothetical protein
MRLQVDRGCQGRAQGGHSTQAAEKDHAEDLYLEGRFEACLDIMNRIKAQ